MNTLKRTLASGLLSGVALLTNAPAAEAAPVTDGASLAEALGLPVGGARYFWNEATQTSGKFSCETPSEKSVHCTLDASSAGAQTDFTQSQVYELGTDGVNITTNIQRQAPWEGDYRTTTPYVDFYEQATPVEWSSQSPLALNSPEGVVQNNIKMVEGADSYKATISSDVPISETFGIRLIQVFDGTAESLQMTAIPRLFLADSVVEATNPAFAAHEMGEFDYGVLDRNLKIAKDAGGTAYRAVSANTP